MASLLDMMISDTTSVADKSAGLLSDATQQSRALRSRLESEHKIHSLPAEPSVPYGTMSLCAIDGASAMSQLQSGDQIVVGSTFSNGQNSKIPESTEQCAYFFMDVRLHSSETTSIVNSTRAMTEIAVLGDVCHDISIIDGATLNNYLSVLLALQQSRNTAQPIIDFLKNETNAKAFYAGVQKVFKTNSNTRTIALAKSDSSTSMTKELVGKGSSLKDKILASTILRPGEFFTPTPLRSTPLKPELLESNSGRSLQEWGLLSFKNWDIDDLPEDEKEIIFKVLHMGYDFDYASEHPDCDVFNQYSYLVKEKHLFFTYYKPSMFDEGEAALRVEFRVPWNKSDPLLELHTLLPELEADIVGGAIKEPFSQYHVDRQVKEAVSYSMNMLKSSLIDKMVEMGEESVYSLSSYRS